jgi:hypothetical protein
MPPLSFAARFLTMKKPGPIPFPVSGPRPSRREYLEALLFSLTITAVLFSALWGKDLFLRDVFLLTYPGIFFFKQSLLAGQFPLWNSSLSLGYPFLAEMANAALYPFSLLHLLFPIPLSMKLFIAVHFFLTGCLMWRLLREWGLGQASGLFGALTWMASGYLVSLNLNFNYLIPATWYPALLFCFHRLLVTQRLGWLAATAAVWAMFLLGGDPQAFLFAGVLILFYVGAGLWARSLHAPQILPLAPLAAVLTLLFVSAQFLPSLEFGARCTKLLGYDFHRATLLSFHPWRLLEWIWPGLWKTVLPPDASWGVSFPLKDWAPFAGEIYLGLLPLFLALRQCRRWREPFSGFLALTLAVFFLLALGYYSPLYRLVWLLLPGYRIFRFPEKHLAVATFALAGLAAFGFERLLALEPGKARDRFNRQWMALAAGLTITLLALLLLGDRLSLALSAYLGSAFHYPLAASLIRASWLEAAFRPVVVAILFLLVLLLSKRSRLVQRRLAAILILLTAADLLPVVRGHLVGADPSLYAFQPSASRIIHQDQGESPSPFRMFGLSLFHFPRELAPLGGGGDLGQLYSWWKNTLRSNLAIPEGLEDFAGYDAAELRYLSQFRQQPFRLEALRMLNVRYYLVDELDQAKVDSLRQLPLAGTDLDHYLLVFRDPESFPRAYFVDGVSAARDDKDFLEQLDRTDFRRAVALLRPAAGPREGNLFLPAQLLSYRPREVKLEVANPVSGHLVLSDTYFPGWEATVDGKPVRILRANYLVRAVALEPGSHQVGFRYRPWSWRIGRDGSLVSLLGLFLALRRRRQTSLGKT